MTPSGEVHSEISRIQNQLEEILNWLKLANKPMLRQLLIRELDTIEKKRVYELTDGTRSQSEIEGCTKLTRRMVGYYWQKWYGLGILVPSEKWKGRMQKIASLAEMGISVDVSTKSPEYPASSEFQVRDLREVLYNEKLFQTIEQLYDFASPILRLPLIGYQNMSRSELVDIITNAFEKNTDKLTQNLFLQALERRAVERQTTEFSKFFDAWARQIGE